MIGISGYIAKNQRVQLIEEGFDDVIEAPLTMEYI